MAEKAYLTYLKYRENPSVMEKLGELYGKNLQNLTKSIEYLEKANQKLPNQSPILQKLGVAYAISGNQTKAIELFKNAVALDPENANLWLNLGYAYHGIGNINEGERCLSRAYELNPKLRDAN